MQHVHLSLRFRSLNVIIINKNNRLCECSVVSGHAKLNLHLDSAWPALNLMDSVSRLTIGKGLICCLYYGLAKSMFNQPKPY